MLTPKTAAGMAMLNKNHQALIARGPWVFMALRAPQFEAIRDSDAAGGFAEVQIVQGTCDVCSSPIKDVAVFRHATTKERLTMGLDCARTFKTHLTQGDRIRLEAHEKKRRQLKREHAQARRAVRTQRAFAGLLVELDTWSKREELPTYNLGFWRSLARQVRDGKTPTPKQLALHEKLVRECAPAPAAVCSACGNPDCVKVSLTPYYKTCPTEGDADVSAE